MAKILEGPAMKLFNKWGIPVPNYVVIMDPERLLQLGEANKWLRDSKLVVKAHEAIGGRFKLGLVKIDLNLEEAYEAAKEMLGRQIGTAEIRQVIVAEMLEHDAEYYVSIAGKPRRCRASLSNKGGIDIEDNWDTVKGFRFLSMLPRPLRTLPKLLQVRDLKARWPNGLPKSPLV